MKNLANSNHRIASFFSAKIQKTKQQTGRNNFDDSSLSQLLEQLGRLDVSLRKSNIGRIQIERFLYEVAKIGSKLGYSQA